MVQFAPPHGSSFFSVRVSHNSEGDLCTEKQIESHRSCLTCQNGGKSTDCICSS